MVAEFLERGYYDGHLATLQHELDARLLDRVELLLSQRVEDQPLRATASGRGRLSPRALVRTKRLDEFVHGVEGG